MQCGVVCKFAWGGRQLKCIYLILVRVLVHSLARSSARFLVRWWVHFLVRFPARSSVRSLAHFLALLLVLYKFEIFGVITVNYSSIHFNHMQQVTHVILVQVLVWLYQPHSAEAVRLDSMLTISESVGNFGRLHLICVAASPTQPMKFH